MNRNRQLFIHLLLLAAAVLGVFANTLFNGFVWDDHIYTIGNEVYRQFDLRRIFLSLANRVEYLPIRDLSISLDYLLWGETPAGFHATNLLLYLGNVILLYVLTSRLLLLPGLRRDVKGMSPADVAFWCALLFAVHPIHSEVVNYITCRNVLLSGLFFLFALHLYLQSLSVDRRLHGLAYAGAIVCFVLSLLAKATAITLPLVLMLVMLSAGEEKRGRRILGLFPFFALSLVFFFVYKGIASQTGIIDDRLTVFTTSSIAAKIAVAIQIPFFYFSKFVVPFGFSAEYDTTFFESLAQLQVWFDLLGLVLLLVLALWLRRRMPEFLFSFGLFLATIIPVLNFFATNPIVSDRYAYLPSIGFTLLVAALLARLPSRKLGLSPALACGVVVACWGALTFLRNTDWQSDYTLWSANSKTSPRQSKSYSNLGMHYFKLGEYALAFKNFAKVKELTGLGHHYYYHKGLILQQKGDITGAIASYKAALEQKEDYTVAQVALGEAYFQSGDLSQAAENFNRTILTTGADRYGSRDKARQNLQQVMATLGPQLDELRSRVATNPDDLQARSALALALDRLGFFEEALTQYLALEQAGVNRWEVFYNAANDYQNLKRFREAATYYEKVLRLNPGYVEALNNLGIAFKNLKEYRQSIAAFERAMATDASYSFAPFNLATTYFEIGDREKALRSFRAVLEHFPQLQERVEPFLKRLS